MTQNILMILVFVVSIGMSVATVTTLRFLRRRSERRAPLQDRQIGHVPGQQLSKRVEEHHENVLLALITMYYAAPIMMLAWALNRIPADRLKFDGLSWVFVAGAVALFGSGAYAFAKNWKQRQAAEDGLVAERVTGMQLNRLLEHGCLILHDLPGDGFNIDHVVISPRGVYAVETKSFRKPSAKVEDPFTVRYDGRVLTFPDFIETGAIEQAERYAQWLSRYLREGQIDAPVTPALALPGWMVEQSEDTWRSARVKVFNPMGRGATFMAKDFGRLDAQARHAISQMLASRYPRVGAKSS